ncbi:MAG: hypothetical protein ACPGSD_11050 [Flavobacteriales bacterium]
MKFRTLILSFVFTYSVNTYSQIGVGTTNPNASSILDVESTDKGILIPRIALTGDNDQTTINNPAVSLLVYNTATVTGGNAVQEGFYYWNGTIWVSITPAVDESKWEHVSGVGTKLKTKSDNTTVRSNDENIFVADNGNLGIGTAAPLGKIQANTTTEDVLFVRFHDDLSNDVDLDFVRFKANPVVKVTEENLGAGGIRFRVASNTDLTGVADGLDQFPPIAEVRGVTDATVSETSTPGRLEFRTTPIGDNRTTIRMVVKESGNIGINELDPQEVLHINAGNDSLQIDNLDGAGDVLSINNEGKVTKGFANSSFSQVTEQTSNYVMQDVDEIVLMDANSGNRTVTLPSSPVKGKRITIKKIDGSLNTVTIDGNGNNLDGNPNKIISVPFQFYEYVYSGTAWFLIRQ